MNFNGKIGAALIGVIGASIAAYKYFFKSNIKILDRQTTLKIIKQIKYQMMTSCVTFAQAVQNTILPKIGTNNKSQINEHLQKQIVKVFQQKQKLILNKYAAQAQQLSQALDKTYKNDKELNLLRNEIETLMQQAIKGIFPDINVPEDMKKNFDKNRVFKIFQDMLIMISKNIVRVIFVELQKNPNFNILDNEEFLQVIRSINIYDLKSEFLQKQGMNAYPGNINQNFFKLVENYKKDDLEFKNLMKSINSHYQKFVEELPNQYQLWTDQTIENNFKTFQLKSSFVQSSNKSNKPSQPKQQQQKIVVQPQPPLEILDDFDWVNIQNIQQIKKAEEVQIPKNQYLQKSYKQEVWWDVQPEGQPAPIPQKHEHHSHCNHDHHGPVHIHRDHEHHDHVKHAHQPTQHDIVNKNLQEEKKVEVAIQQDDNQKIQQQKHQKIIHQQHQIKEIEHKENQNNNNKLESIENIENIQNHGHNQNAENIQYQNNQDKVNINESIENNNDNIKNTEAILQQYLVANQNNQVVEQQAQKQVQNKIIASHEQIQEQTHGKTNVEQGIAQVKQQAKQQVVGIQENKQEKIQNIGPNQ